MVGVPVWGVVQSSRYKHDQRLFSRHPFLLATPAPRPPHTTNCFDGEGADWRRVGRMLCVRDVCRQQPIATTIEIGSVDIVLLAVVTACAALIIDRRHTSFIT